MSLFSSLLGLHRRQGIESANPEAKKRTPEEDFFTEIFAHLIRTQPDVVLDWFNHCLFPSPRKYAAVHVATQRTYPALPLFGTASRVDLVLSLDRNDATDLFFIESKIRSSEGWDQLPKYEATLTDQAVTGERWLIYITRNFEPKPTQDRDPSGTVLFKQLRWHQFYRTLKSKRTNPLTQEIITFMEETNMSQGHRFTASDILTIQHLARTTGLMDATLADEIEERFEALVGAPQWKAVYDNLPRFGRYMLFKWMPAKWWCGLGFYPAIEPDGYPQLGLTIEVDPGAKDRPVIAAAMKRWVNESVGWDLYNLDLPHEWSGISKRRSLGDFLHHEDHVAEVRRFFIECLDGLEQFKSANPSLPWLQDQTV